MRGEFYRYLVAFDNSIVKVSVDYMEDGLGHTVELLVEMRGGYARYYLAEKKDYPAPREYVEIVVGPIRVWATRRDIDTLANTVLSEVEELLSVYPVLHEEHHSISPDEMRELVEEWVERHGGGEEGPG